MGAKFRPEAQSWPVQLHVLQYHPLWRQLVLNQPSSPARDNISHNTATMRLPTLLAGLFACLITDVAATALTYKLDANEKACFYTATKKEGEKVAFYFAVSLTRRHQTHRDSS